MNNRLSDMAIDPRTLWGAGYKIPWNDPAFSARMLREHLNQDHQLASRTTEVITAQAAWLSRLLPAHPASILDIGCGPGLYCEPLAGSSHRYLGIDFSPASIEYATTTSGNEDRRFRLGDVLEADFEGGHDLAMMLYGEINVFPPDLCRHLLTKAYAALAPGGTLVIEPSAADAVRALGEGPNTRTRADEGGLFSDDPYDCLTANHWFEEQGVALQRFTVVTRPDGVTREYRSTTKAWSAADLEKALTGVGFRRMEQHDDWPQPGDAMWLFTARKPE